MRILVEKKCEGCFDGGIVQGGKSSSEQCPRCNGTALETITIAPEELLAAVAQQLKIDMNMLRMEVQTLKARLRLIDGRADHTAEWQITQYLNGKMYGLGSSGELEADRVERITRMLHGDNPTI